MTLVSCCHPLKVLNGFKGRGRVLEEALSLGCGCRGSGLSHNRNTEEKFCLWNIQLIGASLFSLAPLTFIPNITATVIFLMVRTSYLTPPEPLWLNLWPTVAFAVKSKLPDMAFSSLQCLGPSVSVSFSWPLSSHLVSLMFLNTTQKCWRALGCFLSAPPKRGTVFSSLGISTSSSEGQIFADGGAWSVGYLSCPSFFSTDLTWMTRDRSEIQVGNLSLFFFFITRVLPTVCGKMKLKC